MLYQNVNIQTLSCLTNLYEVLDYVFRAVDIQQSSDHDRETRGVDLLHIDLDVLLQVVAVQIEDEVMHKVKAVANDDERQLIRQLSLF